MDSRELSRAVGAANARSLNRYGGYLRKVARNSIRFRKKTSLNSPTGKPPFAHRRGKGIKTILYGYDRRKQTLVVGFAKLGGVQGKDVPSVLEGGGRTQIKVRVAKQQAARTNNERRRRKGKRNATEQARIRAYYASQRATSKAQTVSVNVRPRPTMGPAAEKTRDKLPGLWKDQVKPAGLFG